MIVATTTKVKALFERRKKLVPDALGVFNPSTASRSKGATIWDINDRPQIDFAGGIGVLNAGHSPEPVVKAVLSVSTPVVSPSGPVDKSVTLADLVTVKLVKVGEAKTPFLL